jgi:mevalonate pyrophosphate decarboxylase
MATPPDIDTSVGALSSSTATTTTAATAAAGTPVTQYPTEETAPTVSDVAVTGSCSNSCVVNGGWIVFGGSSPGYAQFSALVRSLVDRVEVRSASYSLCLCVHKCCVFPVG